MILQNVVVRNHCTECGYIWNGEDERICPSCGKDENGKDTRRNVNWKKTVPLCFRPNVVQHDFR